MMAQNGVLVYVGVKKSASNNGPGSPKKLSREHRRNWPLFLVY